MKKRLSLIALALMLLASVVPVSVYAYLYRAPLVVTENGTAAHTLLPVMVNSNNLWMSTNGFMGASGNDTRVQTLGGLNKPWMVSDTRTLTAIPVPLASQTNLYFVTGETAASYFNIITGYGGYVTTADFPFITNNGSIELKGYVDTTAGVNKYLINKAGAFDVKVDSTTSGTVTADINSSTVMDYSSAGSQYTTIPDNNAFSFGNGAGVDTPFSIAGWFYPKTIGAAQSFLSKTTAAGGNYEYRLDYTATNNVTLLLFTNPAANRIGRSTNANVAIQNTWTHIAVTYDGSKTAAGINVYINGVDSDTVNSNLGAYVATGMTNGTANVLIGANDAGASLFFNGDVAEVKMYSVALTPAQVLSDYGGTNLTTNEIAWWRMIEGAGLPQDYTTNAHNATANTGTWITTNPPTGARTAVASVSLTGVASGEKTVTTAITKNNAGNSSFETGGTATTPPTGWTLAGAGASAGVSNLHVVYGSYSANLTRNGANTRLSDLSGGINAVPYRGKTISIGVNAWTSVAGAAFIQLQTDVASAPDSSYHPGDSASHFLTTAAYTVPLTANVLYPRMAMYNSNGTVWFDGLVLMEGSSIPGSATLGYGNFRLGDGTNTAGTWTDNTTSIPDNANPIVSFQNNVMPYVEYQKITVGGTQQLWHRPTSMIIGTALPDNSGSGNAGVITWGANPTGVDVNLSSMVSSAQSVFGSTGGESARSLLPESPGHDPNGDPAIGTTLLNNPLRPFVRILTLAPSVTETQAWIFFGLLMWVAVVATTAFNVKGHHGLTAAAASTVTIALVVMTIWPWWTLFFIAIYIFGGWVSERSPSL